MQERGGETPPRPTTMTVEELISVLRTMPKSATVSMRIELGCSEGQIDTVSEFVTEVRHIHTAHDNSVELS